MLSKMEVGDLLLQIDSERDVPKESDSGLFVFGSASGGEGFSDFVYETIFLQHLFYLHFLHTDVLLRQDTFNIFQYALSFEFHF